MLPQSGNVSNSRIPSSDPSTDSSRPFQEATAVAVAESGVRDVGCYLGQQAGRRNCGQSEPQMHINKEGDPYLRTLLVQGAHHILGPFGADSDLRRWGLKLAERGGKSGKKRAVIAVARKLAILLHHLWVSGEVYEPLRKSKPRAMPTAA
jgi:transposase